MNLFLETLLAMITFHLVVNQKRKQKESFFNKVVKPHNGPSAVLVVVAIGNHVVEDATGFYRINGSLVSNW